TNTEADVLDYYAEKLDDPARPTRYLVDGDWVPLERSVEVYRDRRGATLETDTVYFTHRGPVMDPHRNPLSLRWTVLETASELAALHAGAEARNADGWLRNAQGYKAPPQNVLVADRAGNIAIRSVGRFPIRPGDGTGLVIRDGTTRGSDWQGDWLVREYPFARNPAQGFLSSANQQPLDPLVDSAYLGANWGYPWRALRINQLLRGTPSVTVDHLRAWQTDAGSARADFFVPYFLRAAGVGGSRGRQTRPPPEQSVDPAIRQSAELLAQWDRRYTRDNSRAVLFEMAMSCLVLRVWDELEDSSGRRVFTPQDVMLGNLLQDPQSVWWDRRSTPFVEDRDRVLRDCLAEAFNDARKHHGEPDSEGWRWDRVQRTNIHHLLRIAPLSALEIPMQGGPSTLNPSSGDGIHGSSWRMVVELGPEVRAWGTYPGGQSGNPVSRRYLDRLPAWQAGELDTLRVPREPGALGARVSARLSLTPEP
ncbi:MAG: penicillin acylase family protein, partial [Gemmatimonadetes bacterium]|nr:penicillin acylase family protein [Gemmatimonadota bacterium]